MEDLAPLLKELQRAHADWDEAQAQEEALNKRIDDLRNRRELLDETWRVMIAEPGTTIIQAKMIAHERDEQKKRKMRFNWMHHRREEDESWWQRLLRNAYIALGGK